ncbi:MAG: HAD-IIB family hydrolase [Gammaproteobacteria bacterium]
MNAGERTRRLVVFTDLDGTLLDHDTYDWSPARPALDALSAAGVPLVPVSSKTLAELDVLCAALGTDGPRVAENGAVLALPGAAPQTVDPPIGRIRRLLADIRRASGWRFRGFGDMTADEIAAHTGLEPACAGRAARRLASEPVLWQDSDEALRRFRERLAVLGLHTLRGGRFVHVLGRADKGRALRRVAEHLDADRTLALGDSPNDRAMLLAADVPIVVRRKDGTAMDLPERPDALVTESPGPMGWNQAILTYLEENGGGASGATDA